MIQQQERQRQQHEQEVQQNREQQQIRETRKKVSAARKGKGKQKKKLRQHMLIGSIGEHSKETFGTTFGMQMIADRFGDGWYKSITDILGGQWIEALFGDKVT